MCANDLIEFDFLFNAHRLYTLELESLMRQFLSLLHLLNFLINIVSPYPLADRLFVRKTLVLLVSSIGLERVDGVF